MKRFYQFWVIILTLSALISCWFTFLAVKEGWKYFSLNGQIAAKIERWEVEMLSPSKYVLKATYDYAINNQEFKGQTLLAHTYPNQYAAENDLKTQNAVAWQAWYKKSNPAISSLQKKFPKKESINVLLTMGVLLYFFFARGYLSKLMQ